MRVISDVQFTSAPEDLRETGIIGFLKFVVEPGILIDGTAVRRTRDGRWTLSFPRRVAQRGTEHYVIAPINDEVRREIEREVFAALGIDPEGVVP